jgi:hypothetical protein
MKIIAVITGNRKNLRAATCFVCMEEWPCCRSTTIENDISIFANSLRI